MTESDAVLAANLEFYRAFNGGDYAAMDELWARRAPVLCIHPGWPALVGREAVMTSWRDILGNPEPTLVMCHDDRAILQQGFAVVLCEEELAGGHLVATNIFIKEEGAWRMVHHHAGPLVARPYDQPSRRPH